MRPNPDTSLDKQAEDLLKLHNGDIKSACRAYLDTVDELPSGMKEVILGAIEFKLSKITSNSNLQEVRKPLVILFREMNLLKLLTYLIMLVKLKISVLPK